MVKVKKKEKYTNFRSVNGRILKLDVKGETAILKVTIHDSFYLSLYKKSLVVLLAIINLFCLIFNIASPKLISGIFCLSLFLLYRICNIVTEESLVVVKGLGFQITVKYVLGLKTTFIPQEQIRRIFINEVIYKHKVIYMLTLLTNKNAKERLVPLFVETLPRLACLRIIFINLKKLEV